MSYFPIISSSCSKIFTLDKGSLVEPSNLGTVEVELSSLMAEEPLPDTQTVIENRFPVHHVLLEEHQKCFHDEQEVGQGGYVIDSAEAPIYTTGVAACIAGVALGLNSQDKHHLSGVFHFDGVKPNLDEFFKEMTTFPIESVRLYVYGGHEQEKNGSSAADKVRNVVARFKQVMLVDWCINPCKVERESYEKHERSIRRAGITDPFGLRIGVGPTGVSVSDETRGVFAPGSIRPKFVNYEEVLKIAQSRNPKDYERVESQEEYEARKAATLAEIDALDEDDVSMEESQSDTEETPSMQMDKP